MHRYYRRGGVALAVAFAIGAAFFPDAFLGFVARHLSADGRITDPGAVLAKLAAALAVLWFAAPLAWRTWRPAALAAGWRAASGSQRLEVLAIGVLLALWAIARQRWGDYAGPGSPGYLGGGAWHREDGPLENLTVVCALAAAATFALAWPALSRSARVLIGALALAAFVFAMEEISWGQRLLGIHGPDVVIAHNRQHETNFHNFFGPRLVHQYLPVVVCTAAAVGFAFAPRFARWLPPDLRVLAVPPHRLLLSAGFQLLALQALLHRTAEIAEETIAVLLLLAAVRLCIEVRRAPRAVPAASARAPDGPTVVPARPRRTAVPPRD